MRHRVPRDDEVPRHIPARRGGASTPHEKMSDTFRSAATMVCSSIRCLRRPTATRATMSCRERCERCGGRAGDARAQRHAGGELRKEIWACARPSSALPCRDVVGVHVEYLRLPGRRTGEMRRTATNRH
eukprot:2946949-Prymnesium_polylepis.1